MKKIDLIKQDYGTGCYNCDKEQFEIYIDNVTTTANIAMYAKIKDESSGKWWKAYLVSARLIPSKGLYLLIYRAF